MELTKNEDGLITVTHVKQQRSRSGNKEDEFSFEWHLEIIFDEGLTGTVYKLREREGERGRERGEKGEKGEKSEKGERDEGCRLLIVIRRSFRHVPFNPQAQFWPSSKPDYNGGNPLHVCTISGPSMTSSPVL